MKKIILLISIIIILYLFGDVIIAKEREKSTCGGECVLMEVSEKDYVPGDISADTEEEFHIIFMDYRGTEYDIISESYYNKYNIGDEVQMVYYEARSSFPVITKETYDKMQKGKK